MRHGRNLGPMRVGRAAAHRSRRLRPRLKVEHCRRSLVRRFSIADLMTIARITDSSASSAMSALPTRVQNNARADAGLFSKESTSLGNQPCVFGMLRSRSLSRNQLSRRGRYTGNALVTFIHTFEWSAQSVRRQSRYGSHRGVLTKPAHMS